MQLSRVPSFHPFFPLFFPNPLCSWQSLAIRFRKHTVLTSAPFCQNKKIWCQLCWLSISSLNDGTSWSLASGPRWSMFHHFPNHLAHHDIIPSPYSTPPTGRRCGTVAPRRVPSAAGATGSPGGGWTTGRRFQGPWRNETIYPLVIQQFAIENCHLNLPIKNCGFPWFSIFMLVYQRVSWRSTYFINVHQISSDSHEMANFPNNFSSKFINPSTQSSNFQPASPRPPATLAAPAAAAPRRRPRRPPPAAGRPRRSRAPGRPRPRGHLGQRKVWAKVRTETTQKRSKKCCFYIRRNSKDEMCSNVFSLVVRRKCWF